MLENKYDRYKREAIEQFVDKTQLIATGATGLISHLVGGKLSPALFGAGTHAESGTTTAGLLL